MKRIIAIFLATCILLTGCAPHSDIAPEDNQTTTTTLVTEPMAFEHMSEPALLDYIEGNVYSELVAELNSSDYLIENVDAIYVSKEYLDEVAYNSQANIYFGYTLAELDDFFQDTRYVFTLADDGTTTVKPFEAHDDSYDKMIKNVVIGTGVILVCVTVSVVSGGVGASAVSMIFAASAKTGTVMAFSSGLFSGVSAGVVTGIETGNFEKALKAATLAGSEGFKWGAISGTIAGGAGEAIALKGATLNGLSMNEAALIQKESGYPLSVIKQLHTYEEYTALKNAGLQSQMIGNKLSLVRSDIDLYNVFDKDGYNNFTRMSYGKNPIDKFGNTFEWHHIGQKNDATLALLTTTEHKAGALHGFKVVSEIDRVAFESYKKNTLNIELLNWLLNNAA